MANQLSEETPSISTERNKILNKYRGLLKAKRHDLNKDEVKYIRKAFNYALETGKSKQNYLGEPYILFILGIVKIIAREIDLGYEAIVSAFLLPTVQEEGISKKAVKEEFGENVSHIIDGLIEISRYDTLYNLLQMENYRKMILAVSDDLRVILIKLAQRLYTMRHLHRLSSQRQTTYAMEVVQLYAPLAHRLGLHNLKTELEDLSLRYTRPEAYKNIENKLKATAKRRNRFIQRFTHPIKEELNKRGFDFDIKARTKSIHSIWDKMQTKHVEFEEIFDIFAIRIIINSIKTDEKSDCWEVYSVVTNLYQPNPSRLRDWISVPKSNGYESLHTTVVTSSGKWVEVQIRTQRMHEIAERGLAAHWKYKGGKEDKKEDQWLEKIRQVLEDSVSTPDFSNNLQLSIYDDEIFVFTPKGELKKLTKGSTVLDFAFDIHTDLGATCIGGKVNEKNVSIKHVLKNGDTVEINTGKNQTPKSSWLEFVKTSKARTKIKQILAKEKHTEVENGKEMVQRKFRNWKLQFNDYNITKLLTLLGYKKGTDMYYDIAMGKVDLSHLKEDMIHDEHKQKEEEQQKARDRELTVEPTPEMETKQDDFLVIENQIKNVDYTLAKCCNPIYGDPVFGFIAVTGGIKIHRKDCPNAAQLIRKYPYRVLKAQWSEQRKNSYYETLIHVYGIDEMGIVNRISSVISKDLRVNMRSISFDSDDGMFNGRISLLVRSIEHLNQLINKLEKVKGVFEVNRTIEE